MRLPIHSIFKISSYIFIIFGSIITYLSASEIIYQLGVNELLFFTLAIILIICGIKLNNIRGE